MTIPALILKDICLVSAFITFGLGVLILSRNRETTANRIFIALMFLATYWAAGEFFFWNAASFESAVFWLRVSAFWPLTVACTIHFVLVFAYPSALKSREYPVFLALTYIPALVLSLTGLCTNLVYLVEPLEGGGFAYIPVPESPAYIFQVLFILGFMLIGVYVSLACWIRSAKGRKRRQNLLLATGIAIVILSGLPSGVILPALGIFVPNTVFIGIGLFSLIISYAILNYDLFTLSPQAVVTEIIRTMPDGLLIADMSGTITSMNSSARRLFGLPDTGQVSLDVRSVLGNDVFSRVIDRIGKEGSISDYEVDLSRDEYHVFSIAGTGVPAPDGEVAGMVLILRDITGRKLSERALIQANERISLLTRLTRHDIANMVHALQGYLTLMKEHGGGPHDDLSLESSIVLVERIIKTLDLSREYQEIGFGQPCWQGLEKVIQTVARDILLNDINLETDLAGVEIFADLLFSKVIYNLFENAVRHGGHITRIRVMKQAVPGSPMVIIFEDNGEGVADEEKELIFRYGFGRNTGLGLALSRDILSVTGMTIRETGTKGMGARFEIQVPARSWRGTPPLDPEKGDQQ